MNFALIPFFLAANVSVDRADQWVHGPEYVFQADVTYVLITDLLEEPFVSMNLTTILKCWPKSTNGLVCRFEDDETGIEGPFLIEFDERGVQSLSLTEGIDIGWLNTLRNIVKELSVGVDLRRNLSPAFVAKEKYVLGECATLFSVSKFDKTEGLFRDRERKSNFKLQVLPLPKDETDSIVVIEKRTDHKRCTASEKSFPQRQDMKIKVMNSVSKKHISSGTFKSQTELQIKMMKADLKNFIVQYTSILELLTIEPAKEELPPVSFDVVTDLCFNTEIEQNIL